MHPANLHPLALELTHQHALTHEGVLQVQLIDLAHKRQIGRAGRTGQVVHRASADAQEFGLFAHWQRIGSINHHLALSNPALVSARSKKSFSKVS